MICLRSRAARHTAVIGAVALERLAELVLSQRHLEWALDQGGREHGRGHYPVMVALHSGLLVGTLAESWSRRGNRIATRPGPVEVTALAVSVGAQALRWWCITTLGRQWNTRVVIVPGLPLVTGGPYRWIPHPNYVAVALEGISLPLSGGSPVTAAIFSVADAALLRTRIRVEDAALGRTPGPPA